MTQLSLPIPGIVLPRFDGPEYDPKKDRERLTHQIDRIRWFMKDGVWRTVDDISAALDYPPCSVSAQLRNLRKARFGGFTVNRRRVTETGLYEYQVLRG